MAKKRSIGIKKSNNNGEIGSSGALGYAGSTLSPKGDLNVLIVLVYPSDKGKGATSQARNKINQAWENAVEYYDQASYGTLKVNCYLTHWNELSGVGDDYITNEKDARGNFVSPAPNVKPDQNTCVRLFSEAAQAASDELNPQGKSLNDFQIMACIINLDGNDGTPIRGYSDLVMSQFQYSDNNLNISIPLNSPMYILVVDEQASWGRCAHEVGHCLICAPTVSPGSTVDDEPQQSEDLYSDPVYCPDSSAACFDLMGSHEDKPLFSGYFMDKLGYYSNSIQTIQWDVDQYDDTFYVAAHGLDENTGFNGPVYHLLKICVSDGLSYYVEVRQRSMGSTSTQQVFDKCIPVSPIIGLPSDEEMGGVVVTQVLTDTDMDTNQAMRFINLLDYECNYPGAVTTIPEYPQSALLKEGAQALDLARGLQIDVVGPVNSRPLIYQVRVRWDKDMVQEGASAPRGGDPYAKYNLFIRQGEKPGQPSWESPDIWVEREPLGNNHVWDYGWDAVNNKPNYSGDRPKKGMSHRVWARVYCEGSQTAKNVDVGFYVVTPPYVGFDGDWSSELGHATGNISPGKSTDFYAPMDWIPEVDDLTCILVCVEAQDSETDYSDNEAKEIVFDLECDVTETSGNTKPIKKTVMVKNPFTTTETIYFTVEKAPGFKVDLSKYSITLGPKKMSNLTLTITPTQGYGQYSRIRITGFVLKADSVGSVKIKPSVGKPVVGTLSAVQVQGITYWIKMA